MEENNEGISMICPVCRVKVVKQKETDKEPKGEPTCSGNEYYAHIGETLIKFKNPRHDYHK
jgi:uncharacterized Zn finger protein (UPF0148 family)